VGLSGTRAGSKETKVGTKKRLETAPATGIADAAGTARDTGTKKRGSGRVESMMIGQRTNTAAAETGHARRGRRTASTVIGHRLAAVVRTIGCVLRGRGGGKPAKIKTCSPASHLDAKATDVYSRKTTNSQRPPKPMD
jgi:hypothetical protein